MKRSVSHQLQDFEGTTEETFDPKLKCVLVTMYENNGKTIMQPFIGEQEAKTILGLLENETLEVWLPNGKNVVSEFDVAILKYKQVFQSLTKCTRAKTQVCLKNIFKNLVSCEQCPVSGNAGDCQ